MAKNYESENKAKNYTTDKTSNSRNAMDSQNCGKNSSKERFQKQLKETKHPMHMMHTTEHRMIILTDTKEELQTGFSLLISRRGWLMCRPLFRVPADKDGYCIGKIEAGEIVHTKRKGNI